MIGSRFNKGIFTKSKLVFCERFDEFSPIWNLKEHQHSFLEVIYFLNGGARISCDQDEITTSVFDIIVYPENFIHKEDIDFTRHQEIVCLGFEIPYLSGLKSIQHLSDFDNRLKWLFIEIHRQNEANEPYKYTVIDLLVELLLSYLKIALDNTKNIDDPVRRVLLFINENISKQIQLNDLAEIANYSTSYLDRKFKERTGLSPLKYLKQIRMETAKKLLANQALEISNISTMVGIEDPKYFSRIFSQTFGISPNSFRKTLY